VLKTGELLDLSEPDAMLIAYGLTVSSYWAVLASLHS